MLANLATLTLFVAAVAGQVAPNPLDTVSNFVQQLQVGQPSAPCGTDTRCAPFVSALSSTSGPYAPANVANPAGQNAAICTVPFVTAYETCAVCAASFAPNAGILGNVATFVGYCNANGGSGLNAVVLAPNAGSGAVTTPASTPATSAGPTTSPAAPATSAAPASGSASAPVSGASGSASAASGTGAGAGAASGSGTASRAASGSVTPSTSASKTAAVVPGATTSILPAGASHLVGATVSATVLALFVACL